MGAGLSQAQSSHLIGRWRVEVTFRNGDSHSLRFDAEESGKGSFLLVDPRLNFWGPAKPSEAKWTLGDEGYVMFSGPVQFPLGNVGLERGTLVLKGKLGTEDTITGEAKFFRVDQNPNDSKATPSKNGSFKAFRVTG